MPPCEVSFADGQTLLTGRLDGLTADGLWRIRYGKTRPEDLLRLWLDHLLLQIAAPGEMKHHSVLVAHDGITRLPPHAQATETLADLLEIYRQGLQAPLPFFPKTAWAWQERKASWRNAWAGLPYQKIPGEQDDPYVQLAWRDRRDDPLGAAFQEMAARIFGPLRAVMESASEKSMEKSAMAERHFIPLESPFEVELAGTRLLEAGAGTGKTWTITALVLRLLLEQELEIGQILVVTYTRAATGELRGRIRARLMEALAAFESGGSHGGISAATGEPPRRRARANAAASGARKF